MKLSPITKSIIVIADAIVGGLFGIWIANFIYQNSRTYAVNPNVLFDGWESAPLILFSMVIFAVSFGLVSALVLSESVKRRASLSKTLAGVLIISGIAALIPAFLLSFNVAPTTEALQVAQAGRILAALGAGSIAFGIVAASYAHRLKHS